MPGKDVVASPGIEQEAVSGAKPVGTTPTEVVRCPVIFTQAFEPLSC